jgi:hypothetical protein
MDGLDELSSDVLSAAAGGGSAPAKATAPDYSSVITPQLLDGLKHVESSGDSFAVNPKTGAMGPYQFMPGTVAMLRKQGVQFDPFDEKQSRAAAQTYLAQLVQRNGGDLKKALGQYGGFVTKDPSPYVSKVLAASGQPQAGAAAPSPSSGPDGLDDFSSESLSQAASQFAPKAAPATASATTAAPTKAQITSPEADLTSRIASSVVAPVAAGYSGIYHGIKTLIQTGDVDKALSSGADAVHSTQDSLTYQPRTQQGQQMVEQFGSNWNPAAWIPNAAAYVGDKAGGYLADKGAPRAGAIVNGLANAAPYLLPEAPKAIRSLINVGKDAPQVRIDPALDPMPPKPRYKLENGEPVLVKQPTPGPQPVPAGAQAVSQSTAAPAAMADTAAAAAPARMPPPAPTTPEAIQAVAEKAPAALFPDTPTTAPQGKFTPAEQLQRAQILKSVGIEDVRKSAIEGDGTAGATDFQTTKLESPAGRTMKAIITGERQALINHADTLIEKTGGTAGVDQPALYNRGNTIISPLDKLSDYFDGKARELYSAADERAQGVPVDLGSFSASLGDQSLITQPSHPLLQNAVRAKAQQIGMSVAEDGAISGTAKQAEVLRKFLNTQGKGSNASVANALKESLDNDVMSSGGQDLYTQARALWQQKKATLDNPDGIAKLLQEEGVNRAVPKEMIAPKLVRMPVDQFGHIVQTLKNVPPEIQPAAQSALNEIKAQFANELHAIGANQAGQWNAKGVTKYLQNNAARMSQVFSPEEIASFRNLNDAGHILAKDQSYPGAAVQAHNLVTQGVMHGLPTMGAAAGGAVGGGIGAAVGAAAGRMAAGSVDNAVTLRAVKKRTAKISELLDVGK